MQGKAIINAFDVGSAVAASRIAPGCLVARSATKTVKVNTGTTDEQNMGMAGDLSLANDDTPGFFTQYDNVPVMLAGRGRLRLIGGGTDCTNGMYLQAARDGLVAIESSGDKTTNSVAKCVSAEDIEVSDYTSNITTATTGTKAVVVASTTKFAAGDYVNVKDDNASENALIKTVDSTTQVTLETALSATYETNGVLVKLVECEAILAS